MVLEKSSFVPSPHCFVSTLNRRFSFYIQKSALLVDMTGAEFLKNPDIGFNKSKAHLSVSSKFI